jgi:radical SAM protein with 4Fe4S-binding SPASM domain
MPDRCEYTPDECVWELTLACTMRCIHCGSGAGAPRKNELAVEECLPVADELIALGCRELSFIGGEVFLYAGWEKIARKLTEGGIVVNIVTNASLMGDKQVAQIREAGLVNVGVSVDGMEQNHNRIRNNADAFQMVKKAFARLNREGIPIAAVTSLLSINYPDLPAMYDFLAENGVTVWQIQIATPMGFMAGNREIALDPRHVPAVTRFIREKRLDGIIRLYAADDIGYYDENELYLRNRPGTLSAWQGCQAGLSVVGIDSAGNVRGCESLQDDSFIEGNLRSETLAEIWRKEGNFSYNRSFTVESLTGACRECDKAARCRGGCRGMQYFAGPSGGENPYCCYPGKPGASAMIQRSIP